jgi:hypothetical protein
VDGGESFEAVARERLGKQKTQMAPATYGKAVWTLEKLPFPWLGSQPIGSITVSELLGVDSRLEPATR